MLEYMVIEKSDPLRFHPYLGTFMSKLGGEYILCRDLGKSKARLNPEIVSS
jgi:hypothetical protein